MSVVTRVAHSIRRDTLLMQIIPAGVVFLVLLVFALASWQNARRSLTAEHDKAVEQRINQVEDQIDERMKIGNMVLVAANGFLQGSDNVTATEWSKFFQYLTGGKGFTGADLVGYAPIITPDQIVAEEAVLAQEGHPVAIDTNGQEPVIAPVQYLVRYDKEDSEPFGKDLYSLPQQKTAIDAAIRDKDLRISNVVTFEPGGEKHVMLYVPVAGRTANGEPAVRGVVFGAISIEKLFSDLQKKNETSFGFTIAQVSDTDGKTNIVYKSPAAQELIKNGAHPEAYTVVREYGRSWQARYYASKNILKQGERNRPLNVLLAGIGLSLIASMLVFLIIKYRTRMFALAEEQKLQQAKDELLSLASHQLRTPATGVKQYVGMVLDGFGGPVPDDQVKLLEQAYKSNERQLQIINDFLYVAKLGSGSLTTTKHKFDLALLVKDVVEEMRIEIKEKRHKIQLKIPKTLTVKADEHSVRMIVENLLSNAVKYTQPGGKIEVKVCQGNREVLVSVKDNGVGMSRRDQHMLFKQFSRIPNELTNEVSGSGIGLYLAQQLAMRNGGKITVESEPHQGSTFVLSLPSWRVKKLTVPRHNA